MGGFYEGKASMRVTVRGWARDFGEKEILSCELAYADIDEDVKRLERRTTYFQVERHLRPVYRGRRKVDYNIRVFGHAELTLSGSYLVQLELSRREIARLFYETNGDEGLPELLQLFSEFKQQDLSAPAKQETA